FNFLGIGCRILKRKKTSNMLFLKLGLLLPSHPREIVISLEILSDKPEKTETTTLHSPYPDVPPVEMVVLSVEEMLANKVSAVYKRNKPRDIHDMYLLLKQGTAINAKIITKKNPRFNLKSFRAKLLEKRDEWKSLEPLIVTKLPPIQDEVEFILSCFEKSGLV
ncbi:MAG: nucleotidyl transferase AbiEii/AbiGii toxin family protein, partial [Candidatus Aenigmarchaeota archaeon]|nr:nucleotidyl transferase AbiEii/AbiGii toxin family protein [Candidatus Aenigmarchaeota archaeon]